ncbi:MAG: EpsG family protein [Bacillota bacterium]|nr:EpsG family protein [Bacillota bacterium]
MGIQWMILFVVMAITLVYYKRSDSLEGRRQCVLLSSGALALFSGLRSWWMGDLIKYYTLYTMCNGPQWKSKVFEDFTNIGIRLFFKGMGTIGLSYEVCIFAIALFVAFALGLLIYRYSPSPYWSYLIYIALGFYLFTYSGLKQTIAMGFVCLAIMEIFEENPWKFGFWIFVASLFHFPALVCLLAYPIAKKKIDRMYVFLLIVGAVCLYLFRDQIISLASDIYYEDKSLEAKKLIGGRFLMMILIMVIGLFMRPLHPGDSVYCQVFNLMVVAALIQFFSVYDNVFTRLADYYFQFIVLFMPMLLEPGEHQKEYNPEMYPVMYWEREVYLVLGICITVFAIFFYYQTISGNSVLLDNYRFVWQINPYALYGR